MSLLMFLMRKASAANAFVFTVVTAGADTFQLPIYNGGTYDFHVDWGDSSSSDITAYDDAAANHSYAGAGTYKVTITGTINGWRFAGAGDKTLIHDISAWGPLLLGNNERYFMGCSNLTVSATEILDLTGTTNLSYLFHGCASLTTIPSIDSWNVSSVTNMTGVFQHCTNFDQDIGSWDVSSVTSMASMFTSCTKFNQDIGSWNTAALTSMYYMFHTANLFNQNIGSWNTALVTNMRDMFYATPFNQDIGTWDTSSVTTMNRMFYNAMAFNQNIGSWNTALVTDMDYMLHKTAFNQDISLWDITALTTAVGFLNGQTLSTANYDALLIGWEAQAEQPNVTFDGGNSTYSAGAAATARAALVANGWTITDGGAA